MLTPQPINKNPPQLFESTQIQTDFSANTFTAQDAGIYSQKELKPFWNRVLFTTLSYNTPKLLGKASHEFKTKEYSELLPISK